MTNRFMVSVAALALIAGTGLANAQGMNRETGGSGSSSTMQHSMPSDNSTAPGRPSDTTSSPSRSDSSEPPKGGLRSSQSDQRAPGTMRNERAEDRGKGDSMKAEGRRDRNSGNAAETTRERSQTTGQAGAGARLTSDQRTRITTVIRNERAAPVNNVNFSVSVGARVPREGMNFRPLPADVVTIYPEWRGYEYILVRNQILVIDPASYEIVAILDA